MRSPLGKSRATSASKRSGLSQRPSVPSPVNHCRRQRCRVAPVRRSIAASIISSLLAAMPASAQGAIPQLISVDDSRGAYPPALPGLPALPGQPELSPTPVRSGLEGRWKLISAEDLRADGSVARYPWGRQPVGAIVVQGGACYIQIMSSDVPSFPSDATPAADQMKAALRRARGRNRRGWRVRRTSGP